MICEACRREITGESPMVEAVEVIHEQSFGGEPTEPTPGRTVYFHRDHFPDDPSRYRLVER